jgi:segregation and condensation protein B
MSGAVSPDGVSPEGISEELLAEARPAIEAIVMVADQPIEPNLLAQVLELPTEQVEALCAALADEYETAGRGFQLVRVAGGYRYQSHPDQAVYVERFVLEGQSARLSAAALETMAIVAYKQPISRAQVAAIRGVNVDAVVRTLEHRGYIAEVSRDPGPGQAVLFGTTPLFLERLGLFSLDELPPLGDFVPGADIVEALERGLRPADAPSLDEGTQEPLATDDDLEPTDEVELERLDDEFEPPDDVEPADEE